MTSVLFWRLPVTLIVESCDDSCMDIELSCTLLERRRSFCLLDLTISTANIRHDFVSFRLATCLRDDLVREMAWSSWRISRSSPRCSLRRFDCHLRTLSSGESPKMKVFIDLSMIVGDKGQCGVILDWRKGLFDGITGIVYPITHFESILHALYALLPSQSNTTSNMSKSAIRVRFW